ncbi:MAG: type II secretion system F family protein [Planctomycetaceae bacterium]|jgi:type II secretory pathway component PulF|nr:type II secretion system F family protein [Planctomycetaceae bacterium]
MKQLSGFCRRVGISVKAGLDLVNAVKREVPRQRRHSKIWQSVLGSLENGYSLAESLKPFKKQLGEMFVALIEVGEESGHLGEMLTDLADYYDQMIQIRRDFLKSLTFPIIEFIAAVIIVGIIILVLGVIEQITGQRIDLLGWGLVGVTGFIRYVIFLVITGLAGVFLYRFVKGNIQRSRPIHYLLFRVPKIGKMLKTLALMRLSWGLHLTMRTGMDVCRALTLSFRGSGFAPVHDQLPVILDVVESGGTLTDAFQTAKYLDDDLLSGVDSGEQSGNLPELMQKLTAQYLQESLLNLKILSIVGGFAVYGCIAVCIIFIIFRLFSFYIGIINEAASGI